MGMDKVRTSDSKEDLLRKQQYVLGFDECAERRKE